jgi:aldose 1-epimerase
MAYEITISDGDLEATFAPEVGMIGTSLRHQGEELLYQGSGLQAYAGHGSTFALPLLHPWANRLRSWEFELDGRPVVLDPVTPIAHRDAATGTAIHGLLTASPYWTVRDSERQVLIAELDFAAVPEYIAAFPFPHRLRYTASITGSTLMVTFAVIASGDVAVPVSFGFHPYLTLPRSVRRSWHVELPVARQALVDERMIPTGATESIARGALDGPLGNRTFDTGYTRLHGVVPEFSLADERRRLALTFVSGYPVAQVYAPEDSQFICYEPMTAPVDALISGDGLNWVAPGEEFEAIFTIAVSRL